MHGWTMVYLHSKDLSWPRLKRRHHFLPYIIFDMFTQWLHPNGNFSKFSQIPNYLKLQVMNYVISWAYNFFIFHPNKKMSIIIVWSRIYCFTLMYQSTQSKLILPFKMPFKWLKNELIVWFLMFQMAITFITSYCFWNATPCYYTTFQNIFNGLIKAQFGQGLCKWLQTMHPIITLKI
jgi:hypothetical protein